jgi:hypothetical protein
MHRIAKTAKSKVPRGDTNAVSAAHAKLEAMAVTERIPQSHLTSAQSGTSTDQSQVMRWRLLWASSSCIRWLHRMLRRQVRQGCRVPQEGSRLTARFYDFPAEHWKHPRPFGIERFGPGDVFPTRLLGTAASRFERWPLHT